MQSNPVTWLFIALFFELVAFVAAALSIIHHVCR